MVSQNVTLEYMLYMQRMRNDPSWLGRQHIQRPEKACLEKNKGVVGKEKAKQVKRNFIGKGGNLVWDLWWMCFS